jgi:hypothetical protein
MRDFPTQLQQKVAMTSLKFQRETNFAAIIDYSYCRNAFVRFIVMETVCDETPVTENNDHRLTLTTV